MLFIDWKKELAAVIHRFELELAIVWSSGELAVHTGLCCYVEPLTTLYAPPTLSGGNALLFNIGGERIELVGKSLRALAQTTAGPGAHCLQTSSTEAAAIITIPP